ncbi:hypothetical protein PN836_007610 [Ningiella sp. W23]|uniref:hypothetical protein n=1 Tax=Ningiella sp. W23 TaxID=3023715 RepID=UPI003757CC4F
MASNILRIGAWLVLALCVALLLISLYGLTQTMRPERFEAHELRFGEMDIRLSKQDYFNQVKRQPNESDLAYSQRLTKVIADGTAHIHWEDYEPSKFNQLVPVWENWILYLMGVITPIPEYQRYHFADPYKSMERGIGLCGEVSMVLEQLLEEQGIPANIITFHGHVVVSAKADGRDIVLDPDFGVVLPYPVSQLEDNITSVNQRYLASGYTQRDAEFFKGAYNDKFTVWESASHFITKKYYFEKVSYFAMWLFPLFGSLICVLILRRLHTIQLS